MGYAEVLSCLFILPGKDRLLEAAKEASQVNIKEHRRMAYFSCLAEFEKVVFEELIAFHMGHHTFTTLERFLGDSITDEN